MNKSDIFLCDGVEIRKREYCVVREGEVVPIEPRAFRVLLHLLDSPQKLITKEELLSSVWGDVAVTENSLARAILKLRQSLGDDARTPRFIETVAAVGYRFICPVETIDKTAAEGNGEALAVKDAGHSTMTAVGSDTQPKGVSGSSKRSRARFWAWMSLVAISAAAAVTFAVWHFSRPLAPPRITEYVQLTRDGRLKALAGTDGFNLYLNERTNAGLYERANEGTFHSGQVPVGGGQLAPLAIDLPNRSSPCLARLMEGGISPDGTRMLVISGCTRPDDYDLWVVGTPGHPARYLTKAWFAAWSPDSKQVVFSRKSGDLFTIPSEGGTPRLLLSAPKNGATIVPTLLAGWSPDGRRIRFLRLPERKIWEIASDGSNLHKVLPRWDEAHYVGGGQWTRDGDFYLFVAGPRSSPAGTDRQLWALDERHGWLRPEVKQPIQLTSGPVAWGAPFTSPDGKNVFSVSTIPRGELDRLDKQSNQLMPYLGGISAECVAFSRDGKSLAYVTFPEGILWRANGDGTGLVQLTNPPFHPLTIQWSPDSQQILFADFDPFKRRAMYVVSSQGGAPARLIPDDTESECAPDWFPDGKRIVYSTDCTRQGDPSSSNPGTRILDLESHKITTLPPGPEEAFSPRMSPDGRYISFLGVSVPSDPMIFDMQMQRYTVQHGLPPFKALGFNRWSHDSKYVYFHHVRDNGSSIYRVSVVSGKAELVIDLKDYPHIGWFGAWMGLDPTDTPLLLRDAGSSEVNALTLER